MSAHGLAATGAGDWPLSAEVVVPISSLAVADSPRSAGEDSEHVRVMTESGAPLPPITVHRATMRVVDGMHRLKAAQARGERQIAVRFFDGDERDAFVLAVRSNVTHGLPLSAGDRAAAVLRIHASHPDWSDRAIAAVVGLSDKSVKKIRSNCTVGEVAHEEFRVGRDGRRRPVDAAASRLRVKDWIEKSPEASSRQIAQRAGVSPATVRDVRRRLGRGEDPLPPAQQRTPTTPQASGTLQPQIVPVHTDTASSAVFTKALESLMKDPSLRHTQRGRELLRGLSLHQFLYDHQAELADAVPQHRAQAVSALARACATTWMKLAEDIEKRSVTKSRQGPR